MKVFQALISLLFLASTSSVLGACKVAFDLIDAETDTSAGAIDSLTAADAELIGSGYPPCQVNILATVSNCAVSGAVRIELRDSTSTVIRARNEGTAPYALWGNVGSNFVSGALSGDVYSVRARVNGVWTPYYFFGLVDVCVNSSDDA